MGDVTSAMAWTAESLELFYLMHMAIFCRVVDTEALFAAGFFTNPSGSMFFNWSGSAFLACMHEYL